MIAALEVKWYYLWGHRSPCDLKGDRDTQPLAETIAGNSTSLPA